MLGAALAWMDLMPMTLFGPFMEVAILHPWLHVLHQWLSLPDPSYDDISAWYMQFKSKFPARLLQEATIQSQFTIALNMMVRYSF
jgi:tuftelin-interacting protein 11